MLHVHITSSMLSLFDFNWLHCSIIRWPSLTLTCVAVQTPPACLTCTIRPDLGVAAPGSTVCGVGAAVRRVHLHTTATVSHAFNALGLGEKEKPMCLTPRGPQQ